MLPSTNKRTAVWQVRDRFLKLKTTNAKSKLQGNQRPLNHRELCPICVSGLFPCQQGSCSYLKAGSRRTSHLPFPNITDALTSQWDFPPGQTELLKSCSFILRSVVLRAYRGTGKETQAPGHRTGEEQALTAVAGPIFVYWRVLVAWGTVCRLARSILSRAWSSKVYLLVNPQAISLSKEARYFYKISGECLEGRDFLSVWD